MALTVPNPLMVCTYRRKGTDCRLKLCLQPLFESTTVVEPENAEVERNREMREPTE